MASHLDGGPSPGHSWNSLSLQTYVHSESSGAIGHLSRRPQPSLAWKLAIGRGSFSPADTWSPGLIDTASPATQQCWEAPRSTAGGRRGRCKTDRISQPSPQEEAGEMISVSMNTAKGRGQVWWMQSNLGLTLFQPLWDAWTWTSHFSHGLSFCIWKITTDSFFLQKGRIGEKIGFPVSEQFVGARTVSLGPLLHRLYYLWREKGAEPDGVAQAPLGKLTKRKSGDSDILIETHVSVTRWASTFNWKCNTWSGTIVHRMPECLIINISSSIPRWLRW